MQPLEHLAFFKELRSLPGYRLLVEEFRRLELAAQEQEHLVDPTLEPASFKAASLQHRAERETWARAQHLLDELISSRQDLTSHSADVMVRTR